MSGQATCTAQSCPNGCCDAGGHCRSGTSDAQCGRGGVPCVRCQAGQFCCSTPACDEIDRRGQCACDIDSCPDGCCEDFTTCRPGTTNEFCGLGGLECLTCNSKQVCAEIESEGGGMWNGTASVPPRPVRPAAAMEVQADPAVVSKTRRAHAASAGRCARAATTSRSATPRDSASARRGAVRGVRPAMPRPDSASRWSARRHPISVMPRGPATWERGSAPTRRWPTALPAPMAILCVSTVSAAPRATRWSTGAASKVAPTPPARSAPYPDCASASGPSTGARITCAASGTTRVAATRIARSARRVGERSIA